MAETYDIIIIGGGAAGFTAGMYAARDRCRALLLERMAAGGQVLNCEHIENYPGFPDGVAGYTLGPLFQQQAMNLGLSLQLADVEAVRLEGELKVLHTGDGDSTGASVDHCYRIKFYAAWSCRGRGIFGPRCVPLCHV